MKLILESKEQEIFPLRVVSVAANKTKQKCFFSFFSKTKLLFYFFVCCGRWRNKSRKISPHTRTHTHTHTLVFLSLINTHSLSLSLSHIHTIPNTLSFSYTHTHFLSLFFSNSLSHIHTHVHTFNICPLQCGLNSSVLAFRRANKKLSKKSGSINELLSLQLSSFPPLFI